MLNTTTPGAVGRAGPRRPTLLVTLLTATALGWHCGATDPEDHFSVETSFTGSASSTACTFVFQAETSHTNVAVVYSYELRIMALIAPNTWRATLPQENDVGEFADSLRLSWDVPLATQSRVGRFIRYRMSTKDGFTLEEEREVLCPPTTP